MPDGNLTEVTVSHSLPRLPRRSNDRLNNLVDTLQDIYCNNKLQFELLICQFMIQTTFFPMNTPALSLQLFPLG